MGSIYAIMVAGLVFGACAPGVMPQECEAICSPRGVCEYSDDRAGQGLCICNDENGHCPSDGGTSHE